MAQQADTAHDLSPGLLRQRRNLMVISLVMLFVHYSGAEFGSANLLGVRLTIERPEVVVVFLWVFLGYYTLRYYQYLRQEPNLKMKEELYGHLNGLARPKLQALKDQAFPGAEEYGGDFNFRVMKKVGRWKRSVTAVARRDGGGGVENDDFIIDLRQFLGKGVRSALYVLVNRSYFTDYFLPLLLAAMAIIVSLPGFL